MASRSRGLPPEPHTPRSAAAELVQPTDRQDATPPHAPAQSSREPRRTRRVSLDLDADLVEEFRDAVVYLQRHGQPEVTQVGIVTKALTDALAALKDEHGVNHFPHRHERRLKPGRRPS